MSIPCKIGLISERLSKSSRTTEPDTNRPSSGFRVSPTITSIIVDRSAIIKDHLKNNLNEIAQSIVVINTKTKQAFEGMDKKLQWFKTSRMNRIEDMKRKTRFSDAEPEYVEKSAWKFILSPNKPETPDVEIEAKDALYLKLKNLKILDSQIRGIEKKINTVNENQQNAIKELYGKERILSELKESIDDLLKNINNLERNYKTNKNVIENNLSTLKLEKEKIKDNDNIDIKTKTNLLSKIMVKVTLEEEINKKNTSTYLKKMNEFNRKCIIKHNLMKRLYQGEINDLEIKKKTMSLTISQTLLLDKRLEKVKVEKFYCELDELLRQEKQATNLAAKEKILENINKLKKKVNKEGGLLYLNQRYFFDTRGRCYYKTNEGKQIFKKHITSTLIYQLNSLQNLVFVTNLSKKILKLDIEPMVDRRRFLEGPPPRAEGEEKLTAEERDLLKEELGKPLQVGVAHVTLNRPNNPVAYLGHFLIMQKRHNIMGHFSSSDAIIICEAAETFSKEKAAIALSHDKMKKIVTLDPKTPIVEVRCAAAFINLSEREKRYIYYLCKASSVCQLVITCRSSIVSPLLFILFYKIFMCESLYSMKERIRKAQFSEEDMHAFFLYAAAIVTGCGNYKRIFREKIIPGLPEDRFVSIIKCTEAYLTDSLTIEYLLKNVVYKLYKPVVRSSLIGSYNMFTSKNVTEEDIRWVIKYLSGNNRQLTNKRIVKTVEGNHIYYDIQVDSVIKEFNKAVKLPERTFMDGQFERTFKVTRGYCSGLLELINEYLDQALKYADYNSQRYCLKNIMNYFLTGNRHYYIRTIVKTLKTNAPIEIFLGFVTHWTDHKMVIGELGTIVMLENRVKKHYDIILEKNYEKYAKFLPWSSEFKTRIVGQNDFKYVDVIHYASCSKNPKVIIPYDAGLRKKYGVKTWILSNYMDSLGNAQTEDTIPFLSEEQSDLYKQYYTDANSIFLDLYYLLGVHTARILKMNETGYLNFKRNLINPVTCQPIDKYYDVGETFKSKFGEHATTLVAFRAEGIALYCSLNEDIFKDLHILEEASDLTFVIWLSKVYDGLIYSLHDYNFVTNSWQYVDMLPAFMIARYLLEECGESLITLIEEKPNEFQDKGQLKLSLNRENIYTVGKSALRKLIAKLTVIISTGDLKGYLTLFKKWSAVPDKDRYPLQTWYMDYIYVACKDSYKIAITPSPILKMKKKEEQIEILTEKKLEKSEIERKHSDTRSKHKTSFTAEQSVTELNPDPNLFNMGSILYDDTIDDESDDDEFAPKGEIPTDGVVILRKYDATVEGALTAFVDTYKDIPDIDSIMELTWVELVKSLAPHISLCTNPIQDLVFEN